MRYLDITGTMASGMWSYGATMEEVPPFEHRRWATIEENGYENDWFAFPTLAGTYLETAKHLIAGRSQHRSGSSRQAFSECLDCGDS